MKRSLLIVSGLVGMLILSGCTGMNPAGLNPSALKGGEFGFTGNVMGYGVTVKAVVEVTAPAATNIVPVPTPAPAPEPAPAPVPVPADPVPVALPHGEVLGGASIPSGDITGEITKAYPGVPAIRMVCVNNDKFLLAPDDAFHSRVNADNTRTIWVDAFKGSSGVVYTFDSLTFVSDGTSHVKINPITITEQQSGKTMRCRWQGNQP